MSESEWIPVHRRKGHRNRTPPVPGPPPQDLTLTLQSLHSHYTRTQNLWTRSSCRAELLQILDKKQPDDGWQISQALCLGSGSFSRDNATLRRRSMLQFVAFLDCVRHVCGDGVEVRAQEVVYTDVDVEFLSGLGVEVRREWEPMGKETMVWELFMDAGVVDLEWFVEGNVALFVGSLFRKEREGDEASRRAFLKERAGYHFPRFDEDPNIFEGLMVYWKEAQDTT